MAKRTHNFNAGPAALPLKVLQTVQNELINFGDQGLSIMEMSHRSPAFDEVIDRARRAWTTLYDIPDTHEVLFLQGGASLQFAMVPMNLGFGAAFINTGTWSTRALAEARVQGDAHEVWTDAEQGFRRVPQPGELLEIPSTAPYLHYTSNNTIRGTQFHHRPATGRPLVCDMSSDFISRPIDVGAYDLIYGGAQKNAGPSGITVLIIHRGLSRTFKGEERTPIYLRYPTHATKGSMYNTPNTFGIYVLALVAEWVLAQGGLPAMQVRNAKKAELLYGLIDSVEGFVGHADLDSRSQMNVTWRVADQAHQTAILKAADEAGIIGIKGHRSVGGLRASIYNAVSLESVERLVEVLKRSG